MKHEPIQSFYPTRPPGDPRARIVVVGGGFTGAAATIALLRYATQPIDITIVEPGAPIGTGYAFGQAGERHLLNLRAGELSVSADRPTDFADWAAEAAPAQFRSDEQPIAHRFLPRKTFGAYVRRRLHDAITSRPHAVASTRDAAIEIRPAHRGYHVVLRNGGPVYADAVLLATGYGRGFKDRGLGDNPYAPLDRDRLKQAPRVVLVGSGLTMVDALTSLRDAGFAGEITVVSRSGLPPLPYTDRIAPEYPGSFDFSGGAAALAASVRRARQAAARSSLPWQSVADVVRRQLVERWADLPAVEQARLLRHALPQWKVHRDRLPPELHAQLERERETGGLVLLRGRVYGVADVEGGARVLIGHADGLASRLGANLVLDCSGITPDAPSTIDASLERAGLGARDVHGLGIAAAADGGVIDRSGAPRSDLFALGPASLGSRIEGATVPEIVRQADAAAKALAAHLRVRGAIAA